MEENIKKLFEVDSKNIPASIPIFPLDNVLLLPFGKLPLNIFEERYLKMVTQVIDGDGYLGMVQSKEVDGQVFEVGCLGKIDKHQKTSDGRILINLIGLTRFKIDKEIKNNLPFREFFVNYEIFKNDMVSKQILNKENFEKLLSNAKKLFEKNGMKLNWSELSKLERIQQIYTLIMISPFSVSEKQKLLEVPSIDEISKIFVDITNFAFFENLDKEKSIQ